MGMQRYSQLRKLYLTVVDFPIIFRSSAIREQIVKLGYLVSQNFSSLFAETITGVFNS